MTFIPVQTFDNDGTVEVLIKKEKVLESIDTSSVDTSNGRNLVKGKARIKNKNGVLSRDDLTPYSTLTDAEQFVLTPDEVFWFVSSPPMRFIAPEALNAAKISRAMANISTMSKHGFGNTVIYNPVFSDQIEEAKVAQKEKEVHCDPNDLEKTMTIKEPYFNEDVEFIEHPNAPDDCVLVLYRGSEKTDQPLIYIDGEGLLLNNSLSDVGNFGKFVRLA